MESNKLFFLRGSFDTHAIHGTIERYILPIHEWLIFYG